MEVRRLLGTYGFLSRVQIEEFVLDESSLNPSSCRRGQLGELSDA
jgi:hypothetical protein